VFTQVLAVETLNRLPCRSDVEIDGPYRFCVVQLDSQAGRC
jgi:hypothetical protein